MRDDRRWRISIAVIDHHIDVIGRKDLKRACQGGLGKRVRVDTNEERSVDTVSTSVMADRLTDRQDVRLIERVVEG